MTGVQTCALPIWAVVEVKKYEPEIEVLLRASLVETQKDLGDREITEEDAKQMINDTVAQFRQQAKARIDKVYAEYALPASGIAEYLKKLATTKDADLSKREKIQRDAIRTFLAIMSRYEFDFTFQALGTTLVPPQASSKES